MRWCALIGGAMALWGTALVGQSFDVVLGGRVLGSVSHAGTQARATLATRLGNTPMNVFNGRFDASSEARGALVTYDSASASDRKTRSIGFVSRSGTVEKVEITPTSERTGLSDPARVPAGVLDPVRAFGRILTSGGCPARFAIYDGRRAITVTPAGEVRDAAGTTCDMDYRVSAGPGHLSPLKIKRIGLQLFYDPKGTLRHLRLKSGVFQVMLRR